MTKWGYVSLLFYILVSGFFFVVSYGSWGEPLILDPPEKTRIERLEERNLSLGAMAGSVGVGVTAGSIVLAVIGAIVGLGNKIPPLAKDQFLLGAGFCGSSLIAGALAMAALPQLAWKENVAFSKFPSVLVAIQIYALLPAFAAMFLGTWVTLSRRAPNGSG